MSGLQDDPTQLRITSSHYRTLAKTAPRNPDGTIVFGAVNVMPKTLERWAADLDRRANLIQGGRKPKR